MNRDQAYAGILSELLVIYMHLIENRPRQMPTFPYADHRSGSLIMPSVKTKAA